MIPTFDECRRGFETGWRLLSGRHDALTLLDIDFIAFWRSFLVVFPLLPFIIFMLLSNEPFLRATGRLSEDFDNPAYLYWFHTLAFFIQWIGFPLIMLGVTYLLNVTRGYAVFIIAYNWSSLFLAPLNSIPRLIFLLGLTSLTTATLLNLIIVIISLRILFITARRALSVDMIAATGITMLAFYLDLAVIIAVEAFFPLPLQ